ncbi:Catabolite control protein A [Microbacterium sp. MM2322]
MSDATRERVQAAATRLGYVANAMAAGLRARTKTVGVVLRDINRPYYSHLLSALQAQAEVRGYRLVAMTSAGELDVANAISAVRSLVSLQVDGVILASAQLDSELIKPFAERVPMVVAGRMELGSVPSVFGDETHGGRRLAEFLLGAGHRHIAVGLVDRAYSMSQHLSGQAMIDQIRDGGGTPVVFEIENDWRMVDVVEPILGDRSITAVMCPTDASMLNVLGSLQDRNVRCPEHLSITGYGGIGELASAHLGFTTYRQPVDHIGVNAINLLVDAIESDQDLEKTPEHRTVHGEFVTGRTVRLLADEVI